MRRILLFIRHWLRSNSRHGTHSPFVYDLVNQCVYALNLAQTGDLSSHFRKLRTSKARVTGIDHGSEAKALKTFQIAKLAGASVTRDFEAALLSRLVAYHKTQSALELGANIGKATAFMASGGQNRVLAIEGNEGLSAFASQQIEELQLQNAVVNCSTFESFFNTNTEAFEMIFIDGDHRLEPTLRNYSRSKQALKGEGPIVLHDIYWSKEMTEAWEEIKADSDATVTIDLFFFGLVYFRPGQRKEHFNIRFPRNLFLLFP